MGLNVHHKDSSLSPAESSVQKQARTVGVHSCTCAAAMTRGTRSALGRAGSEAVPDFRLVLETIPSAAVWCGCDPKERMSSFQSFLLAFS